MKIIKFNYSGLFNFRPLPCRHLNETLDAKYEIILYHNDKSSQKRHFTAIDQVFKVSEIQNLSMVFKSKFDYNHRVEHKKLV